MIENIRRIGLFLITAQTVMHFTAGQQYEKYMRIITGIIVLLLFITPFTSYRENTADAWQKELERITEKIEGCSDTWPEELADMDYGSGRSVIQQLEDEMKRKLNDETNLDGCEIADVTIKWKGEDRKSDAVQDMSVEGIRITLRAKAEDGSASADKETEDSGVTENPISIERIQISLQPRSEELEEESAERMEQLQEYSRLFAGILEIEEEKVEVVYNGRG